MSDKERKKINEKTRKQQEAVARAKADALRDDDNVFDVSFEQQGAGGNVADSVVSATDIKVSRPQGAPAAPDSSVQTSESWQQQAVSAVISAGSL